MTNKNNVVEYEDSWDEHLERYDKFIGSDKTRQLEEAFNEAKRKSRESKRELEEVLK
jgi:prephenate dehydrogenase